MPAIFLLLSFFFFSSLLPCSADELTEVGELGLPMLCIESENGQMPTCDYVSHPEGCDGYSIANATKVPGRLVIILQNDTLYDSGSYVSELSGMTFRIRGNTSAYGRLKPYKIKLQKKADLLLRSDKRFKDKNWVLLPKADVDLLVGYRVSQLVGMPWTPSFRYVNLIVNGEYQGLYQLCESVGRNEDCRIALDKEDGFLVEHDAYWWNESFYLTSGISKYHYSLKYPEPEEVSEEKALRIQYRLQQMESSFQDGSYARYIDVENFAAWMLAHDILGTSDAGGSNMYYSCYDDAGQTLIQMPVLWDFDTSLRTTNRWASAHTDAVTFFPLLFASPDRTFVAVYYQLWQSLKNGLAAEICGYLRDYAKSKEGRAVAASFSYDAKHGGYENDFNQCLESAVVWLEERFDWLEGAMRDKIEPLVTGIPHLVQRNTNDQTFNLLGQRVGAGYKGVVVRGGRKKLVSSIRPE